MYIKCRYIPPSIYIQKKVTLYRWEVGRCFSVSNIAACYYQSKKMFSHYFIFEQSPFHKSNLLKRMNNTVVKPSNKSHAQKDLSFTGLWAACGQPLGSLWAFNVEKYLVVDKKFHCFVCGLSIQYSCLIDMEKVDSILRYLMTPSPCSGDSQTYIPRLVEACIYHHQ